MNEILPLEEFKTQEESVDIFPAAHKNIEDISAHILALLGFYERGKKDVALDIVDEVYRLSDQGVLYSEYVQAVKSFDSIEEQYPKMINGIFTLLHQHNPIPGLREAVTELQKPLKYVHTPKKQERYLGFKNRDTARSLDDYAEMLELKENDLKGKILDIGSGSGEFSKAASASGADVVSMDVYPTSTEAIQASWQKLPFRDESFDKAVSLFAFPVWVKDWEELEASLAEIIRVTKRGGEIRLMPGAPVIEPRDVDVKTARRWKQMEIDLLDAIHRPEFESILQRLQSKVDISFGEPHADLGTSANRFYVPMFLKKK